MVIPFFKQKLKDIPISRKLYFTVGIMALLVTIELCTLWLAVNTLSSVRAYIVGEGLWSKAQKDAVYHLRIYATSHNEKDYQAFQDFLKVPLGDRKTRIELSKAEPNREAARQGFIEGRNHPDDVDGMIDLIRRFHSISYLSKALVIWGQAEQTMEQLIPIGQKIHNNITAKTVSQSAIDKQLAQAEVLNTKVTKLEDDFSFTLGEGSRWLEGVVLKLLLTLSLTIGTTSILITISVSRRIERGLNAIIDGASLITAGSLSTRVPVYSKDEIGVLATSFNQMTQTLEQNISDLKQTEENLKKAKERAEASEKAKQLFVANMSHEIRTPMNAILGFAKLLEESLKEPEQQEYIHIIIRSGDDLLVLLNDILDFSKMEASKLVFESKPFNLREMLHSNIQMVDSRVLKKEIAISYLVDENIPDMLLGDAVRLSQVLLNLTTNAVKFTEKGEVKVSVNIADETDEKIVLEFGVKDTGIGIPLEKQQKIFESFEQVSMDTSRRFGGSGLGLSIAKQLVELQGGEIFVISKPGMGADFHFKLPFLKIKNQEPVQAPAKQKSLSQSGEGIRVLVVEDIPMNQVLVTKVLYRQGFETDIAANGIIALEKYNECDYDIILMDLQMPEMDGYETTSNIRKMEGSKKDTPIIAMTAHTTKGERERCMEIGMNDFISKPYDSSELYDKVLRLVKKD